MNDPAERAYAAYSASVKGKNYYGLALPPWQELGPERQRAWGDVADALDDDDPPTFGALGVLAAGGLGDIAGPSAFKANQRVEVDTMAAAADAAERKVAKGKNG